MKGVDELLLQVQRRVQQAGVELRGEGLGGAGVVVGGRHEPGGDEAPRGRTRGRRTVKMAGRTREVQARTPEVKTTCNLS